MNLEQPGGVLNSSDFLTDLGAGGKVFLAAGIVERFALELGNHSYFAQCEELDRTGCLLRLNFRSRLLN